MRRSVEPLRGWRAMTFDSSCVARRGELDGGHSGRNRRSGARLGLSVRPRRPAVVIGSRSAERGRRGGRDRRDARRPGRGHAAPTTRTPPRPPTSSSSPCRGRATPRLLASLRHGAGRQDRRRLRQPAGLRQAGRRTRWRCRRAAPPSRPPRCCRSRGSCAAFHHVSAVAARSTPRSTGSTST